MIPSRGEERRRIVPRWRSPEATVAAGEFESTGPANPALLPDMSRELDEALERWDDAPSIGTAAEVLAAASMAERESEAVDAAEFVVSHEGHAGPLLHARAVSLLAAARGASSTRSPDGSKRVAFDAGTYESMQRQIGPLKRRVLADPQDSLAWLEMGRLHATVGNIERAMRAVRTASLLAPDSRYVLRSASRFFLHAGELDTAHEILRRSARTKSDPWLSAAEIAAAQVAGEAPRSIRSAKQILQAGSFTDHDMSELRSALATISLFDGRKKDAKKFLEASLRAPTENAVAQGLWLAQAGAMLDMTGILAESLETPRSFEARSMASYNVGQWEAALSDALCWYQDEPFSGRAAVHASVIAGVALERYAEAIEILRSALRASPGGFVLQTNLVYNLAQAGQLDEAAATLREIKPAADHVPSQVVMLANSGLLSMRRGNLDAGRKAYEDAIALALDKGHPDLAEQATMYFLAEELAVKNLSVLSRVERVVADAKPIRSGEARVALSRIQRLLERLRKE